MLGKLGRALSNYENPGCLGARLRARRIGPLKEMIDAVHARHGEVRIIDIGGRETYWNIFSGEYLESRNVQVTIVNLPEEGLPVDHGRFRFVAADGCDLGHIGSFSPHIAHANSVIEHVGDWSRMARFAAEVARVAERYFVQTPNYWFPLEPHCMTPFFHWFPRPLRIALVLRFRLGHWDRARTVGEAARTVESVRLLDRRQLAALFPEARIVTERFCLLAKSFVAVRGAEGVFPRRGSGSGG